MSHVFEYALLRAVPRQERGEFLNVGVLLYCSPLDYLRCKTHVDEARLRALDPGIDLELLGDSLRLWCGACDGSTAAQVRETTLGQRFRWLTAPRSTLLQTSPTHTGRTEQPDEDLDRLWRTLVLPPA
ncbi:DUF3037 domain-containing protein [Kibdelosporangium phytohabitans]|uniref:DUF3037 domain-containing protein n=1 Tax=Kibdelosporangium phytohabitans TaxID=860235 RepID=A0A0N9HUF9_9PSEU|nr:DUF3037 domain-containing protein [Kibdelosporangium phytohabitans]ALG07058.1 hypothetical protein AOZ06_09065 [Kibdelosporangium phytohabitans]MBE1468356.1 hypothetical protein [Kibdelosporangium phytohabitans]